MNKVPLKQYLCWYGKVQQRLDELNKENEFKTLHWYELGYRGKNRRLCLIRDDCEVLACGLKGITQALYIIRGKRLWQD